MGRKETARAPCIVGVEFSISASGLSADCGAGGTSRPYRQVLPVAGEHVRRAATVRERSAELSLTGSESSTGGADGVVNVVIGVSGGEERGLELRRREIDAVVEHGAEEASKASGVAAFSGFPIGHRLVRKEKGEHRADAIHGHA